MNQFTISLLLSLGLSLCIASAQDMFDYSDIKSGKFEAKSVSGVRSMNDGEHYTVISQGRVEKHSYQTGQKVGVIFDASKHTSLEDGITNYELSGDERKILLTTKRESIYRRSFTADYWVYDIPSQQLQKLTKQGGEQVATFSPDGNKIAFVRNNNIYYVDLTHSGWFEKPISTDGVRNEIINGHTDWVYEEEFGFTRAFEFSPDGEQIAYLRFDERQVPQYTIRGYTQGLYPQSMTYKYPMAGERNSVVELWVSQLEDGVSKKIDTGTETDQYIPRIGWTPTGELFFYLTNRQQNEFKLLLSVTGAEPKVIYREQDRRYVERVDDQTVTFLPKGDKFVVKNETSGFMHLYLFSTEKGVLDTITRGNWDVTQLVDVTNDRVYYMSTEGSPLRRNLYSSRLNGRSKTRLTEDEGVFSIVPSSGFKYFISYFSNISTPNLVRLHSASGKVIRVLEGNADLRRVIEQRRVPRKEFFTFATERSTTLNGYIIKPYNFDPSKKYPLLMTQYSGPGSQQVLDRWSMDWTDVMVQEGYIVVCVDGRGTGARGAEFRKITYANLGGPEVEDQISAAKHFATQPYIDMSRIGIYGWSYGGFMALNCILKGADIFKMAIAVAPVTSWRFYDTIYTELYNGLPQDNPYGYDANSPIEYADKLKGNLLIIHGTADDNVHVRNSYRMIDALVKVGKRFDVMIYPDNNHGMAPTGSHHVRELMIDYTLKNL